MINTTPTDVPLSVSHPMIAAALAALRTLLLIGGVELREAWQDSGSGPGRAQGRIVAVRVDASPAARDALLAGMTDVEGPHEWHGSHNRYRDWRGYLLAMPVLVTERIDRVIPPESAPATHEQPAENPDVIARDPRDDMHGAEFEATDASAPNGRPSCADHPGFVPDSLFHLRQHIETDHADELAEAETWGPALADSLAGIELPSKPPYLPDADPAPLLKLVLDERYPPAEVIRERPVIVPGRDLPAEAEADAAWSRYARVTAHCHFGAKRYPSLEAARDALRYWSGFDMLSDADREYLAASLVQVEPEREPTLTIGTDRRRFLVLPVKRRQRRTGEALL